LTNVSSALAILSRTAVPDVLEGRVEPGRVFDRTVGLDDVATGYQAMADRTALKVLIRP
jgi:hypothetical protein